MPRSPSQSSALHHGLSGYLSDSAKDSYTSEEYYSWIHPQTSPTSTLHRAAALVAADATLPRSSRHPRVARKLSADSIMDYRTYQMEEPPELLNDPKYMMLMASAPRSGGTTRPALGTTAVRSRQYIATSEVDKAARISELQLARKPMQVRPEDFHLYQPDMELEGKAGAYERSLQGLLYIHLFCGHGLKSSRTVLRDLYCVLEVDAINKARTMIRTGAINFDWDEEFDLDLDMGRELSFLVYSWDPNTRHRLCFSGTIGLHAFLEGGNNQKIALKLEPKGILYLI